MKKVALIVVCLLTTLFSYSQSFSKVLRSAKLEYKEGEWVKVEEQYPEDYFIILDGYNVTIGTHKFKTYGESEKTTYDDHVVLTWKCVNKNGDKCLFMMKKFRPEVTTHTVFGIGYDTGVIYEYETE
jgi:hypothetical protein